VLFFDIVATDTYTLFAALRPAPEGGSKVLLGDGPDDPLSAVLEGLLCQHLASQLGFHFWEEEKVRWGEVQRIGWVGDRLYPLRR
jgi:hypothetical protein